jgi:DNA polymerase I-like protein with 3'-5' exonuclease and polymerase domains
MDAYATWHTYQYLVARGYLDEQEWRLLDVLMQEERALAPMELNGIKLDVPKLTVLAKQYRDQERELYAELKSLTGLANPGSDKQIGSWLYDTRRIPVAKYTEKGGRSVDEDALKRILKRKHLPSDVKLVVEKVLGMRGAQKKADRIIGGKKKTGVSLFENTDEHGILTTRFNQCGTSSGRLSTSPQVQNWDREGPLRECLITRFNDG